MVKIKLSYLTFLLFSFFYFSCKSENLCQDLFLVSMYRLPINNSSSPRFININYDSAGNHNFNISSVLTNSNSFIVTFIDQNGEKTHSGIQEFIPVNSLYSIELQMLDKMSNYLKSTEFFEDAISEKIKFYGLLEESGKDRHSYQKVKEPNLKWKSNSQLFREMRKDAITDIANYGIEVGFFIAIGITGKIKSSKKLFTSFASSEIRFKDIKSNLDLINHEFGEEPIKEIHFYHLHPKGTPLSPTDTDFSALAFTFYMLGYSNMNYHIYAIVLDANKNKPLGVFHHSILIK